MKTARKSAPRLSSRQLTDQLQASAAVESVRALGEALRSQEPALDDADLRNDVIALQQCGPVGIALARVIDVAWRMR